MSETPRPPSPSFIAGEIAARYGSEFELDRRELADAIEAALKARDERAVRIIREHRESDKCEGSCWEIISNLIRGKD